MLTRALLPICLLSNVVAAQSPTPEPPPQVAPDKPTSGFDKGFFLRSTDDRFSLHINGRFQPFFDYTYVKETGDSRGQFEMRRMRLVMEGNVHGKAFLYKLQTDFGRGVPAVRDVYADIHLAGDAWLRLGQWKRPWSRQQINPITRIEMTERSITDAAFGAGRDIGIAIRNDYELSRPVEWIIGVFNGRGDAPVLGGMVQVDPMTGSGVIVPGSTTNTNVPLEFRPAVVGRVGFNRNGLKGYTEADLEGGPLRYGAAASVWLEGDMDDDAISNQKVQADYMVKAHGFSTTGGVYFMTAQDGDSITKQEPSLLGMHVQASYMLNKHWSAAARYALVEDVSLKQTTVRDRQEITVAGNFFGIGHEVKFQGAMILIKNGLGHFTDALLVQMGATVGW